MCAFIFMFTTGTPNWTQASIVLLSGVCRRRLSASATLYIAT